MKLQIADVLSKARAQGTVDLAIFPDGTVAHGVAGRWILQDYEAGGFESWLSAIGVESGNANDRLWRSAGYAVVDARDAHGGMRVTITGSRSAPEVIIRLHGTAAPELVDLHWPEQVGEWTDRGQGVIVISGPGDSGKSSLGAALIRKCSGTERLCWLFESPLEFEQPSRLARSWAVGPGKDFPTFAHGVVASMTATVSVVLVGQVNDERTARAAFDAARQGKLVIATMLAGNVAQSLDQLVEWGVTPSAQAKLLLGCISLRLPQALGGDDRETHLPRVGAYELWEPDQDGRAALRDGRIDDIQKQIAASGNSLEACLAQLVEDNRIDLVDARKVAVNPEAI